MKIKLGIAYHKACQYVSGDAYIPIQVGAAVNKVDLGIQKDSDGENISRFNPYCCELSATYWLWKNCDADYLGLCHYRRFYSFSKGSISSRLMQNAIYSMSKLMACFIPDSRYTMSVGGDCVCDESEIASRAEMFAASLNQKLEQHKVDCFCLARTKLSTYSCKTKLMKAIGLYNYNKLEQIVKEKFPDFYPYFDKTMHDNAYNPCNMIIASKEVFADYAHVLFSILEVYHEWISSGLNDGAVNNAALRASGYMGEFLTSAYVMKLRAEGKEVQTLYPQNVDIAATGLSQSHGSILSRIFHLIGKSGGG